MPSISRGRVLALDVHFEVSGLLRLVVAVGALLPLYADVVLRGLVLRDLAVRLGPVVAMGALLPLDADAVLHGLVHRDLAVRLGPVFAVLVVTEPLEHINIVHGSSVMLEVDLLLHLVLAPKLSASMPSYADVVHVGSVLLDCCPSASPCASSWAPGTHAK